MLKFSFLLLVFVALVFSEENSTSIVKLSCDSIETYAYWNYVDRKRTCSLGTEIAINEAGAVFEDGKDETIEGLYFDQNKKIVVLPEKVSDKFPNLIAYGANKCSVKNIAKIHFENLPKLRRLNLDGNNIANIASDTFDDLVAMEFLGLGEWIQLN
jgi:Leucine-rich repeat (LRR) protein